MCDFYLLISFNNNVVGVFSISLSKILTVKALVPDIEIEKYPCAF